MNWYKKARFEDYNEDIQNDISEAAKSCELMSDDLMDFDGEQDQFEGHLDNLTDEIVKKYYPALKGKQYSKFFNEFRDMIWDKANGY